MTLDVSTMRKHFLITGASRGIGAALAESLILGGQEVTIVARQKASLAALASKLNQFAGRNHSDALVNYIALDMSIEKNIEKLAGYFLNKPLAGIVHNAGIIDPMLPLIELPYQAWKKVMAVNVNVPLLLTQLLQHNITGGKVLHIGSGAAYLPIAGWGAYCTSKAALSMLTQCWQQEQPPFSVASVMPGIVDSYMQDQIREAIAMHPAKRAFFIRLKRENKLLTPATVACFLTWLLLECPSDVYVSKEWDIYDSSHHAEWLKHPHIVPNIYEDIL